MNFEVYKDKKNEWRWRLRTGNGKIVATSGESYKNKADCLHMINRIKNYRMEANIREIKEPTGA